LVTEGIITINPDSNIILEGHTLRTLRGLEKSLANSPILTNAIIQPILQSPIETSLNLMQLSQLSKLLNPKDGIGVMILLEELLENTAAIEKEMPSEQTMIQSIKPILLKWNNPEINRETLFQQILPQLHQIDEIRKKRFILIQRPLFIQNKKTEQLTSLKIQRRTLLQQSKDTTQINRNIQILEKELENSIIPVNYSDITQTTIPLQQNNMQQQQQQQPPQPQPQPPVLAMQQPQPLITMQQQPLLAMRAGHATKKGKKLNRKTFRKRI
jgi:hypothetical protein